MRFFFVAFFSIFLTTNISAQSNCTITGTISDELTGEKLIGASIIEIGTTNGTSSDANGSFSLNVNCNSAKIKVSYLGYQDVVKSIEPKKSKKVKIRLQSSDVKVENIDIKADKIDKNVKSTDVGTIQLDSKEIGNLPALLGKPDIIAGIRLTPGIQAGGEGNSGIFVRGGDAGQNLILLNDIPLYNPSHLMGFFPAFNSDIVETVSVSKGAIPANYGGKTSSVIDIQSTEANTEQFSGSGSLGLLSADLTLQLPINNKGGMVISGRRTYLEALKPIVSSAFPSTKEFFDKTNYYFYDVSVSAHYKLTDKDRIYLTGIIGNDSYTLEDLGFNVSNNMIWGNSAGSIRYNRIYSNKLSSNFTVGLTNYGFKLNASFDQYKFDLSSNINDYYSKLDINYLASEQLKFKTGIQYTRHHVMPNKVNADVQNVNYNNLNEYFSDEYAAYIQSTYSINQKISFTGGLRYTYFRHIGPYTTYIDDITGQPTDSVVYNKNELVKSYHTLGPNLSFVWLLNQKASIKGSVGISHQFVHLASVGTVSLPTDLWLPSNDYIKPQQVTIASIGYFQNFWDNIFESSVEIYYKDLKHQIDFANGLLDNLDNRRIKKNIVEGTGQAYGVEFFLKKQLGETTGWASYTLSRTWRDFPVLSDVKYPAKYDRVHDFSITLNHQLNERWSFSAILIYATGNAMTLPVGRYFIQGNLGNEYTDINSFRMPPYHRLDLSANYKLKQKGRIKSNLNFSIYNVYNRSNPYFIYFKVDGNLERFHLRVMPQQISLFPILPTVTWNFKF